MGFLSQLTQWLFAKKKDKDVVEENLADPVYIQMVRRELQVARDRQGGDDYVRVSDFLDALEGAVDDRGFGNILGGGDCVRIGAAHHAFDLVAVAHTPFFYKIAPGEKPSAKGFLILPENCYVQTQLLAGHGLHFLDEVHETALASVYATALRETAGKSTADLRGEPGMVPDDGRGMGRFSRGTAVHNGAVISVLYMTPQKNAPQVAAPSGPS